MSTTIDSLQIEIQSRSTNAAKGIDDLAKSLGKIKENGGFRTAVNNLERLSRALDNVPNAHKQSTSLRTLAGALDKLKNVGSLSRLNSSLESLPTALSALDKVYVDSTKVTALADALTPLSTLKYSGFSSMVNAMDKLDKVTKKLDANDGKLIDDFAEKVKKLNDVVAPLSANMGNIADGFKGINAVLRTTNVQIGQANTKVNVGIFNLSNLSNVLSKCYSMLRRIAQGLSDVIEQASEWDGISSRFGRGFGSHAQETYDYILKLNDAMDINVQQFMQYSSTYATMLKGYGVAQEDAAKMARSYMELTYDIWAGSNDFYKTLEDAAIAIRSAISGESESIKKMGFSVTDAMLEQTIATHGLEISLANATEAQKSYLRYLSLVDQAHAQNLVGTYAEELNNAEGLMRTLNQQFKSLGQTIGSLFLPILTKVLPYVQAFVDLLSDGVIRMAQLLGVEIQKADFSGYTDGAESINDLTGSLNGATDAVNELKNATIGIDELNVISPASDISTGSSGENETSSPFGDIDSLWDQTIFDTIQTDVDMIKDKLADWVPLIAVIGTSLAGLSVAKLVTSLAGVIGQMSTISKVAVSLGVGLTLTAINITDISVDGEITADNILTAVGSTLAFAGFGFTVGGVHGALIGLTAGLTLNVAGMYVGVISAKAKNALKEDLEAKFGNITLDQESLEVYIDKITAVPREVEINGSKVPVTLALDIYAEEKATLEALEDDVYGYLKQLDVLNIKIAVGVDVTQEEYQKQIDNLLVSSQEYLDQFYLTTSVAIDILDSDSSGNLSSVLEDFYQNNSSELASLGTKLKDAVSNAFVDGLWIPDKLQEALELQQEIQEILDYVSEVEYRAMLGNLSLSVSGDMLTSDSFKDVLSCAQSAIEERLNALEEVKMSQLQVAVMEYDANLAAGVSESEAKKIYDTTVADIEKAYQDGRIELTYGTVDFGLDTLRESFGTEIDKAKAEGLFNFDSHLSKALTLPSSMDNIWQTDKGKVYGQIAVMASDIKSFYDISFASIDGTTRKNLKKLLKELEPTMADYEDIASTNREAGETVPEEIRKGLNDYNELAALSGDVDAINYLIGEGFSTDTTFLNTLATVEGAGKQIDESVAEGLLNNLSYVTDEATGLVTGIKNSITGEVIAVTPTLKSNMESLGVNLSTGVLEGAESEMQAQKKTWKDWAIWPWNWFKEENEINSPSKVFERGGNYLVQGLINGISVNALKERLNTLWDNAKNWWDNKPKLSEIVPTIDDVKAIVSGAWDKALNWWDRSKAALKEIAPSIVDIKSKLQSAWETAKKWWQSSVGGISTTLSIKVPKITLEWDTVTVFGQEFKYPSGFDLSFAGNGGMFDQGSLIWAGERGPEVLANAAGGRTGVMNVEQMQEAVYEGVYAAITAAMSGKSEGGAQAVNVYLDGRQITSAVEQRQRERGASIMGNGVYSY